jgi:TrmH family RNA methyltransferase
MIINSRQNEKVKRLRALMGSPARRRAEREYVCEGLKLFEEAKAHAAITSVFMSERAGEPETEGLEVHRVSHDIIEYISSQKSPQGIIFTCKMPERAMEERLFGKYIILDGISDPGNMGTIIRTADAFGLNGLLLCGHCADIYNPKTIRAAMGSLFRLPVFECEYDELEIALKASELPLFRAQARPGAANIASLELSAAAVAVGSEAGGLSERILSMQAQDIIIPMRGAAESLNAAVAASIIMWEMSRG